MAHFLKYIKLAKSQCKYPFMLEQQLNALAASGTPLTRKRNELYLNIYSAYEELLELNHKVDYSDFIPGLIHLFENAQP